MGELKHILRITELEIKKMSHITGEEAFKPKK